MRKIDKLFSEGLADSETTKEELQEIELLVDDQRVWEEKAYNKGLKQGLKIGVFGMIAVAITIRVR